MIFPFWIFAAPLSLRQVSDLYIKQSPVLKSLQAQVEAAVEEKEAARNLWPAISWDSTVTDQKISEALYGVSGFFQKRFTTQL